MLQRRGLLGLFAAAPVIIAADRLMPARSPWSLRPFTMADLEFVEETYDHGFTLGIGAQFRLNGILRRHAVAMPGFEWTGIERHREFAKGHLLRWANDVRLAA